MDAPMLTNQEKARNRRTLESWERGLVRDRARRRWHLALETAEEQETRLFRRRAQHKAQQAALTTQAREASSNKELLCNGQEQWKCPRRERLVYIKSAAGKSNGDVRGESPVYIN